MFSVMPISTKFQVFNNAFENIISNIIYQQVAFKVARESELRLFAKFNYQLNPRDLIEMSEKAYKAIKITGNRINYIKIICRDYIDNPEFWNNLSDYSDEEIAARLLQIKGIGNWTVEMFLLFGLGRKDVISLGDLIIVNGLKFLYDTDSKQDLKDVVKELRLYGTIVSINLWKFMEQGYYKKL